MLPDCGCHNQFFTLQVNGCLPLSCKSPNLSRNLFVSLLQFVSRLVSPRRRKEGNWDSESVTWKTWTRIGNARCDGETSFDTTEGPKLETGESEISQTGKNLLLLSPVSFWSIISSPEIPVRRGGICNSNMSYIRTTLLHSRRN